MAFVAPLTRTLFTPTPTQPAKTPPRPTRHPVATYTKPTQKDAAQVRPSPTPPPIYGSDDDVCTFGQECQLTEACVSQSPALHHLASKYVFPMREHHTQVFFDNSVHPTQTLMIVFAEDRHGLVLDVVSVLKALKVRVHRTASNECDALQLIMSRVERELVSVRDFGLELDNCVAFWITDEQSGSKIFSDGERLAQITECVKIELDAPYPRPRPAFANRWHRVSVQKDRAGRYTVFSIQTNDRPRLLVEVSEAFAKVGIDVASASINTFTERVENHFFVTKRGEKKPLRQQDIEVALESVMKALLAVGEPGVNETLWYQSRDGSAVLIAEAIFIDEVNNQELACFKFSKFETPNFRGRLPDAPYRPIAFE